MTSVTAIEYDTQNTNLRWTAVQQFIDVMEKYTASIFRSKVKQVIIMKKKDIRAVPTSYSTIQMGIVCSCETSVKFCVTTLRHISEDNAVRSLIEI
jgi:hypothetical protein